MTASIVASDAGRELDIEFRIVETPEAPPAADDEFVCLRLISMIIFRIHMRLDFLCRHQFV